MNIVVENEDYLQIIKIMLELGSYFLGGFYEKNKNNL